MLDYLVGEQQAYSVVGGLIHPLLIRIYLMSKIGCGGGGGTLALPVSNTFSDRGAGISNILVGDKPMHWAYSAPSDRIGFI